MWFSGRLGGVGFAVGLHVLECLFQPKRFYDSSLLYPPQTHKVCNMQAEK